MRRQPGTLYRSGGPVYNTSTVFYAGPGEAPLPGILQTEPRRDPWKNDVIISIKGTQKYENADQDVIELVTEGRLEREGGSYTLSYQESELTGLEGTLTTFQIEPERVTLLRVGEYNSQMVFEEGRRHMAMYNTPYGAMTVGVNTRHLLAELDDQGGDIEIDYAIEIDHAIAGRNIFQIKVKEAEAALLDVHGSQEVLHSGIETAHTNIAVQDANIAEAKTKLWQLEQDYHRFERLLKEESVPEQQFEQTKAAYEAAKARYQALVAQKQSVLSQYTETSKKTTSAEAAILRKEADLDLAKLNLSYTVLIAPYDGYMGRRTLEPGQYVQTGQTISYLVRNKDKWITANYKETQIANIYIGQQVRIKVDAVPGKIFHGEVTAISEATGSKYSLVPTDNSAGNFVKVQQRIPVRIELEDVSSEEMAQLRTGMMVETEALRK